MLWHGAFPKGHVARTSVLGVQAIKRSSLTAILVVVLLAGLPGGGEAAQHVLLLADPSDPLDAAWVHRTFGAATNYERVKIGGQAAIRAEGRQSASELYREVAYRTSDYPWIEWAWRVDRLQSDADIRTKAAQDFAASIFLIFEEPMLFMKHSSVLSYVWINDRMPAETLVENPYHPGTSWSIVIESGEQRLGQWVNVRRNVAEDYRRAFGKDPPDLVKTIALFTDNDQTGEAVTAYYGAVRALQE